MNLGPDSMCSGDSEKPCCSAVRHGKFSLTTGWDTRIQAWEIATANSLWKMSSTVKNGLRQSAWVLRYRRPYLGYMGYKQSASLVKGKRPKCYNEQRVIQLRACSSVGRAPALQAGGRRFEPGHVHQLNSRSLNHLRCNFDCTILVQFRDNRYNGLFRSRKNESIAHSRSFIEAHF